ncbi:hypothetical protein EO946_11355 [Bacillus spizizenii ATCC 6633 = JCM 2499]|nr:hypothetical protein DX925_06435 [Bacillus subtilis]MBE0173862.1 hypothetical protein [Bacillus spizizenii]MDR4201639.1 hypothetical protein [Bacillus spizizenii ATCC 6633 = JCM 2499]QCY17651.1 hypothetical protein EO946_11355 [Bacillus spizizenii ATCC 6633 = JCM 2499]QDD03355.1 hypothetical protein FIU26_05550 [Bacillus subtilis]
MLYGRELLSLISLPKVLEIENEKRKIALCTVKQPSDLPFCIKRIPPFRFFFSLYKTSYVFLPRIMILTGILHKKS